MELRLEVPETELYLTAENRFITVRAQTVVFKHSLVSISKWESKWHIPWFTENTKTDEQIMDYIKTMTISQHVKPEVYLAIQSNSSLVQKILEYMKDPMTATTINDSGGQKSRRIVTAELIYCWMFQLGIPVEFQKWHINRLITLIRVCGVENAPPKKMSKSATMNQNRSLNAMRRAALHSKG